MCPVCCPLHLVGDRPYIHLLSWVSVSSSCTSELLYVRMYLQLELYGEVVYVQLWLRVYTREAGLIRGPTTMGWFQFPSILFNLCDIYWYIMKWSFPSTIPRPITTHIYNSYSYWRCCMGPSDLSVLRTCYTLKWMYVRTYVCMNVWM